MVPLLSRFSLGLPATSGGYCALLALLLLLLPVSPFCRTLSVEWYLLERCCVDEVRGGATGGILAFRSVWGDWWGDWVIPGPLFLREGGRRDEGDAVAEPALSAGDEYRFEAVVSGGEESGCV